MMVIICKEILCVHAGTQPLHPRLAKKNKKKNNQPNKPAAPSLTVSLKDNPAAKFLGGINLFSAYPMVVHAGYKIQDYFLLG